MLFQHELPPLGTRLFSYRGHDMGEDLGGFVNQVAWSPDGTRIASCGSEDIAQIGDAPSGQCYVSYNEPDQGAFFAIAWSPDSTRIVSASTDNTLDVWWAV